ncbi:MAG: serpin family protein [Balneolaceae bacterium]|nr:serpin family protein [Balneolaceae bacterium]
MRTKPLLGPLLLFVILAGCTSNSTNSGDPEPFEPRELPRSLTESETNLVHQTGQFGFRLIRNLATENPQKNHLISPLSIQMAYGMAMNGANGDTYTQIRDTFGFQDMSREEINESAKSLLELLVGFDENVTINVANSIWYRDSFSVEQEFLQTNETYYGASVTPADFSDPATVGLINGWVAENTEGLIENIVTKIDPLMMMYLLNAVYFQGDWTYPFDPENTEKEPFRLAAGSSVEAEMMHLEEQENMYYKEGEDYRAVNLYYGDAGFAMTMVLPVEDISVTEWLETVNWEKWQQVTSGFREVNLTLTMPKFEMKYEIDRFKQVLKALGIRDAFEPTAADFSRINPDETDLHISDTRHKTFIKVDEKGTEAAAVTSVGIETTSEPQSREIRFDRPYFYVIREVESGSVLFMGIMQNPVE